MTPPPTPDRPAPPTTPAATPEKPVKLRWRDTWLIWDNSVSSQTVGFGKNYLSSDPTYEMSGSFRPRYYLYDGELDSFFAAGRIDIVREFTNSDVTTERGETTLSDATLLTGYRRTLASSPGYETIMTASLPILTFPTSKFSMDNGTILGLGTEARLSQTMPLAGEKWTVFKTLTVGAVAGYNHTFTRATQATNPDLRRVRLDPEGRTVPGDQLAGAAFPEHELHFNARLIADITEKLSLFLEASYRPTWKYSFKPTNITDPSGGGGPVLDPTAPVTYVPVTSFEADVYYDVIPELSVAVGYVNVEVQPGLDGQRRSIFYSPGSQFYLSVIGHLDAIYLAATGKKSGASNTVRHLHP
ncbi:MAG TPA: hypothetical protein VH062_11580 [Polyangiaceae bacterium]|nr:hypothetical protein [Polyangiaceae bacterium]